MTILEFDGFFKDLNTYNFNGNGITTKEALKKKYLKKFKKLEDTILLKLPDQEKLLYNLKKEENKR